MLVVVERPVRGPVDDLHAGGWTGVGTAARLPSQPASPQRTRTKSPVCVLLVTIPLIHSPPDELNVKPACVARDEEGSALTDTSLLMATKSVESFEPRPNARGAAGVDQLVVGVKDFDD